MQTVRVTITFYGRLSGALGIGCRHSAQRTLHLPDTFTLDEAEEAARVALYEPDNPGGLAFERVSVIGVFPTGGAR